jgi:hypothetical protein
MHDAKTQKFTNQTLGIPLARLAEQNIFTCMTQKRRYLPIKRKESHCTPNAADYFYMHDTKTQKFTNRMHGIPLTRLAEQSTFTCMTQKCRYLSIKRKESLCTPSGADYFYMQDANKQKFTKQTQRIPLHAWQSRILLHA